MKRRGVVAVGVGLVMSSLLMEPPTGLDRLQKQRRHYVHRNAG